MVGPSSLIIFCNIICFTLTVVQVRRVGQLVSKDALRKEGHENIDVYIKLSSMTGSFWLLDILAVAINQDFLRFVSIILNGLQGLFIFLSYTANSKVLKLYRGLWNKGDVIATSAKTQSERTNPSRRQIK
ncbi:adhesion G-protein coupled receptor D1 [Biomphalaria glabrata]|uniref:G-protein coupled receptors family 2 profile 2 domain-containing protein n=1 Tax=Biomphalaria glabrata TaxID=6526 RepID=A0A2C9KU39_BIOGL|nr:adhesion G-protein coupled receptor D1 [Biomphalaria glabrata]